MFVLMATSETENTLIYSNLASTGQIFEWTRLRQKKGKNINSKLGYKILNAQNKSYATKSHSMLWYKLWLIHAKEKKKF